MEIMIMGWISDLACRIDSYNNERLDKMLADANDIEDLRELDDFVSGIEDAELDKETVIVYFDEDGELNWYTENEIRNQMDVLENIEEAIARDDVLYQDKKVMDVLFLDWSE